MFLLADELGIDGNVRYLLSCVELHLSEICGFHDECPPLGRGTLYFHQYGLNVVQVKRSEITFLSANELLQLSSFFLRARQPLQKGGKQDEEDSILWVLEEFPQVEV